MFILFLFVYLVSMNLLLIKTEENIIRIEIKAGDQQRKCHVPGEVTLDLCSNFTLEVRSIYFIKKSYWNQQGKHHDLQNFKDSKINITYERSTSSEDKEINNIRYNYVHTQKINDPHSGGTWNFTFELIRNYDPWTYDAQNQNDSQNWWCNTSVEIKPSSTNTKNILTSVTARQLDNTEDGYDGVVKLLIILVCVLGILLLVQSSFIIYGKARNRQSNRNDDKDPISPKSPKTKRGANPRRNIADRPPLPLPPDEVVKQEPMPPPMSPIPKRHHFPAATAPPMPVENPYNSHSAGPLVPKQSYRKKVFDISDGGVKNPAFVRRQMEGPLVPKKSYRNKELDNSDEDMRSPGFPRRHMDVPKKSYKNEALATSDEELRTPSFARRKIEAKFAQLPPKGLPANTCFKLPKPLPRASNTPPSPPPVKVPPFNPAHREEPAPSLHPKKLPILPPPAPCRQPDPRLSDEDWQYEKLQPATKYLNNFSDSPYDNMYLDTGWISAYYIWND